MSMRRQIFGSSSCSSMRSLAIRSLTAPFRRSSNYPTRLRTGIGHRQPAQCMPNMTGSFRIWALVSSNRPRSPLRLTQLPMTRLLLAAALVAAFFLSPLPTAADARFARLSEPGIVAILGHAFAPGTGDPATFSLDDCATQRNLDAQGREQARKIGAAIRAAGATVDRVVTSQWCRRRDTARFLDLGPVEDLPALNSFFRNRDRAGPQTAELRQFLLGLPPAETVVLVTHQVNITALTGRIPALGEVFLLEIGRDGTISVVDEILIGPWR